MRTPVSVGVVGLASSGLQLANAFASMPAAELRWVADHSRGRTLRVAHRFPQAIIARDLEDLLDDETLDAVVIATPAPDRAALVRRALQRGKHVFVRSPMAMDAAECAALLGRADASGRRLYVGDPVLVDPAVRMLKSAIDAGDLGELYYLRGHCAGAAGERDGLLWRHGVSAVALVVALLGDEPVEISARGGSFSGAGIVELASCRLGFATGIEVELTLSSLEPEPAHQITAVGSLGVAQLDRFEPRQPLRISDLIPSGLGEDDDEPRSSGDTNAPRIPAVDSTLEQCERFVASIRARDAGAASAAGRAGATVVSVIRALEASLAHEGEIQSIGAATEPPLQPATVIPLPVRSA